MAWVKLDDHFDEHPKIAQLSDSAFALFVVGLAYCNRNLTDGFIPEQVGLGKLRYCDGNPNPAIRELEAARLWIIEDSGWRVHDFLDFQPSKESVLAEREAARERKAKSRSKSQGTSRRDQKGSPALVTPPPVPVPETSSRTLAPKPVLDELKSTLVELYGEPSNWALYNRIATFIRDRGGTPEEMRYKSGRIAEEWGVKACTPTSLEKHWTRYDAVVGQLSPVDVEKYQAEVRRLHRRNEILGSA